MPPVYTQMARSVNTIDKLKFMEKILLAIDAVNPDTAAIDFACYIATLTHSKLTGVFLENLIADERPVMKKAHGSRYFDWELDESSVEYMEKRAIIDKSILLFKQICDNRCVRYTVRHDRGRPAHEIIMESRFSDLVILDAQASFNKRYEGMPTEFVKDVLKDAECSVVIAPQSFDGIEEIIFTYNGKRSSVFAIKQFTHLFPEFADKKVVVLRVDEEGDWADTDKQNLNEWMQYHYSMVGYEVMKGNTQDRLFDYLFKRKNVFVVMGAYGRSGLSRLFRASQADLLIKTITQPIFISHY